MAIFSASRRFRSLVTFPMICFLCAGGHLSVKMKEKYSHTRQEAKRQATVRVAPQIIVPQWREAEKLSTSWAENSRLARRINTKARICECGAELASPGPSGWVVLPRALKGDSSWFAMRQKLSHDLSAARKIHVARPLVKCALIIAEKSLYKRQLGYRKVTRIHFRNQFRDKCNRYFCTFRILVTSPSESQISIYTAGHGASPAAQFVQLSDAARNNGAALLFAGDAGSFG